MHFASVSFSLEDFRTVMYMLDTAHQAGITGRYIKVEDIGWDNQCKCFVNENKVPIVNIFPVKHMFSLKSLILKRYV